MSALTPILHEATVAGVRVRFFGPQAGTPDFPWHVADDLFAALRFPRPVRQHFQRSLRSDHGSTIRTVATSEGIVTLAPHFMAQGAIGAGVDIGCAPYEAENDYAKAGAAALTKLADGLGLGGLERVQRNASAFNLRHLSHWSQLPHGFDGASCWPAMGWDVVVGYGV